MIMLEKDFDTFTQCRRANICQRLWKVAQSGHTGGGQGSISIGDPIIVTRMGVGIKKIKMSLLFFMLSTEAFLSNNCRVLGTLLKIWLKGDVKWHSGLVWAFNSSSPGAPGSNPKHTNYTFYWYIWYMLPTYCHLSQSSSREI